MKCLVCDFGGSSVKYALVDEKAVMEHSGKIPAPLSSIHQFVDAVGELYDRFREEIEGIAISIPGYVDPENGYLFGSGVYTPLYQHSIIDILKDRCPVPIAVENDGKCGALSEVWEGALADCNDGAVVILGSGIAGGIIKDRRIHSGKGCIAGEFSYMVTAPDDCSMMGYAFMSAAMLGMTYKMCKLKNLDFAAQDSSDTLAFLDSTLHSRYNKPKQEPAKIKADGKQLFKWLEERDPAVEQIYMECLHALKILVYNVQICYAPEKIVIGGGLSAQDRLIVDLQTELDYFYKEMDVAPQMRSHVVRSKYLDECNLVGAMYNYLLRYKR